MKKAGKLDLNPATHSVKASPISSDSPHPNPTVTAIPTSTVDYWEDKCFFRGFIMSNIPPLCPLKTHYGTGSGGEGSAEAVETCLGTMCAEDRCIGGRGMQLEEAVD